MKSKTKKSKILAPTPFSAIESFADGWYVVDAKGEVVADCTGEVGTKRDGHHARLFAAAPGLLDACRAAIAATQNDDDPANLPSDVLDAMNAFIAKAEGKAQ